MSVRGVKVTRNDEGFSVLEAMVAMAILAAGLLPILALQGQFVRTVTQIEHVQQSLIAQENALNLIKTVDLIAAPSGEVVFDDYRVSYDARPIAPGQQARVGGGQLGRFELTLYTIDLTINYSSGREDNFSIRDFGWRPTQSFEDGL